MWTALKAKLALLIQTKVGATVLATVLVAGGGSAVAAAATHGDLSKMGSGLISAVSGNHDTSGNNDNADHSSAEGLLTAYTAPNGNTPGSITVQPDKGNAEKFDVTGTTKVNGYHTESQQTAGQQPQGTPGASQHSSEQVGTLSDLQTAVTSKERVQVQANKDNSGNWVAWKVTIEGPQNADNEQSGQSGQKSGDQGESQNEDVSGKIKSIGTSSFVITAEWGDLTVNVNGSTAFAGSGNPTSLSNLSVGESVEVRVAKQSDGSYLATGVYVEGSDSHSGDGSGSHEPTPSASPSPEGGH